LASAKKQAQLGPIDTVSGMTGMENLRGVFLTHLHSDHTQFWSKWCRHRIE
jgi:ribonuclease BN (tRNA processing enzyme)